MFSFHAFEIGRLPDLLVTGGENIKYPACFSPHIVFLLRDRLIGPLPNVRNRYAAWYERLIIGMHGDNYHLTHHLLPGIPHWTLAKATKILREDRDFRAWDDVWGGIFSKKTPERVSFIGYVIDDHGFTVPGRHPAPNTEKAT